MKKSIIYLAAAIIAIPALNSCKKGEEDPLSLNSRDSRITGTWSQVSESWSETTTTTSNTSNSVNSDTKESTKVETNTKTLSGGSFTKVELTVVDGKDVSKASGYDITDGTWDQNSDTYRDEDEKTTSYTKTLTVSIYKDNTYTATTTIGASTVKTTETDVNNGVSTIDGKSVTDGAGTTSTEVEEGTWLWLDAKKSKIHIMAGPLNGMLLRLAKDELIISQEENDSDADTDISSYDELGDDLKFNNYSKDDPADLRDGTNTLITNSTSKETYTSTWEKTDKESHRAE
jgi:hypothetical protein